MQTKKMSLANIKGKLSRAKMKQIMAGSGNDGVCGCQSNSDCGNPTCKMSSASCFSYNGKNT
ncbi:MAG: hypothetical protein WKF91_06800 [Segetibacter sp.]